ncbi:MAG: carboxypeptidase-like regulatory domain-containing protein, partial [Nitrososphaerales archaeon]
PDGSNLVTTSVTNSYSDTSLAASTTYYYKVSALDTSNNEGIVSDEAGGTTSAPTVDYMHVESIDFKQKGPRWLDIMVTIYDSSGSPVSGATVYMDITISGSVSSVTAVTNAEGIATHKISRPDPGTYSVVVTNVTHSDFVYAAGANKENDDNYTVTSKK